MSRLLGNWLQLGGLPLGLIMRDVACNGLCCYFWPPNIGLFVRVLEGQLHLH